MSVEGVDVVVSEMFEVGELPAVVVVVVEIGVVVVNTCDTTGLVIFALPFFTARSKETTRWAPDTSRPFPLPEHFLSHFPLDDVT